MEEGGHKGRRQRAFSKGGFPRFPTSPTHAGAEQPFGFLACDPCLDWSEMSQKGGPWGPAVHKYLKSLGQTEGKLTVRADGQLPPGRSSREWFGGALRAPILPRLKTSGPSSLDRNHRDLTVGSCWT